MMPLQMQFCVPIAPAPPAMMHPSSSSSRCVPLGSSTYFNSDQLLENDVLLRKGGRPTHGKQKYFGILQERAAEYASYKSPIDRRLLARELVNVWIHQGGRFCIAVAGNQSYRAPFESSTIFRVATSEESLQFTRRVLVRHFTHRSGNVKRKRSKKHNRLDKSAHVGCFSTPSEPPNIPSSTLSPRAESQSQSPRVEFQSQSLSNFVSTSCSTTLEELAASEAADALCFLHSLSSRAAASLTATTTILEASR